MMHNRYKPIVLAANGTFAPVNLTALGAFMATATGAITITDGNGVVVLNLFPVQAGQRIELQMYPNPGSGATTPLACTVTLTGGAAGTLLYY